VQGCPRKCEGCFNPDTQPFVTKELVSVNDLESRILAIKGIDGVTFSGGEPFAQAGVLAGLAKQLRRRGLTVVCYTGYMLEELRAGNREDWNVLLEQIDLLIDGPFIQSERCHEPYRGSANQKMYFLSDRIRHEEVRGDQTAEFTLGCDGKIFETGFPKSVGVDETFAEIEEILNSEQSR
jgi:anaerobic ribonucleoside-triphosphate reductase activating protein